MSITIREYSDDLEEQYERLLQVSPVSMFNHSLKYKKFLKKILPDCHDHYICAIEGNKLVAVLPLFIRSGPYGKIVNSLPFFGSHGGFIYTDEIDETKITLLLKALDQFLVETEIFSCTLIESPLELNNHYYKFFAADLFDERIGQFTPLYECTHGIESIDHKLLGLFHPKTRNMVRKAQKSGFEVSHDGTLDTKQALYSIHKTNIQNIGGKVKEWDVFWAVHETFDYDADYRIYTARKDGKIVSALLLFYFKDIVEYFMPATLDEYKSHQPLSLLIYTAMLDAISQRKMRLWNWGGTWLSQNGVYRFKSRWGSKDFRYLYHTKLYHKISKDVNLLSSEFIEHYPYFYLFPFSSLESTSKEL